MTTFISIRLNVFVAIFGIMTCFNLTASIVLPTDESILESTEQGVRLEQGTPITLKVFKEIRSDEVVPGDLVELEVHTEVNVDGKNVLMATGYYAEGRITRVRKAGSFGRSGFIEIEAISAKAVDGQRVPLEGKLLYRIGKNRKGMAFGMSIGIPVVGVILGGPALVAFATVGIFVKGGEAVLSPDTLIPARIAEDVIIRS